MFDDQRVAIAAAGSGEDHGLAAQRDRVEEVEEVLEQAGVAAFEGRRSGNQHGGRREPLDDHPRGLGEIGEPPGFTEGWAEILDVEGLARRPDAVGDLPRYMIDEQPRLGRAGQIARDSHYQLRRHSRLACFSLY